MAKLLLLKAVSTLHEIDQLGKPPQPESPGEVLTLLHKGLHCVKDFTLNDCVLFAATAEHALDMFHKSKVAAAGDASTRAAASASGWNGSPELMEAFLETIAGFVDGVTSDDDRLEVLFDLHKHLDAIGMLRPRRKPRGEDQQQADGPVLPGLCLRVHCSGVHGKPKYHRRGNGKRRKQLQNEQTVEEFAEDELAGYSVPTTYVSEPSPMPLNTSPRPHFFRERSHRLPTLLGNLEGFAEEKLAGDSVPTTYVSEPTPMPLNTSPRPHFFSERSHRLPTLLGNLEGFAEEKLAEDSVPIAYFSEPTPMPLNTSPRPHFFSERSHRLPTLLGNLEDSGTDSTVIFERGTMLDAVPLSPVAFRRSAHSDPTFKRPSRLDSVMAWTATLFRHAA